MKPSQVLVGLVILTVTNAAPWPTDIPQCARECAIAGAPKLAYQPGNTYSYSYTGMSTIQITRVENGVTKMEWTSEVDLTWLSPCDMAITFKNPSFGGGTGSAKAHFLTRYPMVVAMTDGRVQHVCSHPEDDTWAINLKKGVASILQNSLPSNSSVNNGLNITETDVTGTCATLYKVQDQGEHIISEKVKNLNFCQDRFPTQAEIPVNWFKAPLPMQKFISKCKQEINKGLYVSILCEDDNTIKPTYGSYKYIVAKQVSRLQFQRESTETPHAISNLHGHLLHKRLLYDHETLKKDPSLKPEIEHLWKEICERTVHGIEVETAALVRKAIHIMRQVPEETIEQMLEKIKTGEICREKDKLESIFLDAIAYVQEPSTVKLMVQDILGTHTHFGRTALYTAALYLTPRPTMQAIEHLKPLFQNSERHPMATLAGATLVNTYCKHHPHCENEAKIREVDEILGQKVQQHCIPSEDERTKKEALVILKALGNMGVMTPEVARIVIQCLKSKEVDNYVRVTAAQAFRNAKCHREPTRELVRITVDEHMETEIRIASFLAAVKCAEDEDLRELLNKISKEDNTQVRGFILSHLINLQDSSAPYKERLRYLLSSFSIPANFSADIRKYSRNADLSYYSPSLGVGAGIESNIVYAPGSFIPRSIISNLTSTLGATPVNIGEFGVRIEGMEPDLRDLFGPQGYFKKSSLAKIFSDLSRFFEEKSANIHNRLSENTRERRSIDISSISAFFGKLYGDHSKVPRADIFARIGGQEIAYATFEGRLHNMYIDRLIQSIIEVAEAAITEFKNKNTDSARVFQLDLDYSLPTIQGIPLKLKLDATAVLGLKMESRLNDVNGIIKLKPSFSVGVNGYIGFDSFLAKCGLKTKTTISSSTGVSMTIKQDSKTLIDIDLPDKMEVVNIKSETYLMKALKGQPEMIIKPEGINEVRFKRRNCLHTFEQRMDLKLCYDIDLPNVFLSEGLPLGSPTTVKIVIDKAESMSGYHLKVDTQNDPDNMQLKLEIETKGTSTPKRTELMFAHVISGGLCVLNASMASETNGGFKVELRKIWTGSEKELLFTAYSSHGSHFPQDSQVIEAMFSSKSNDMETQVIILTKTLNSLKSYIDHHFEVQGAMMPSRVTGFLVPKRLEKLDFHTIIGNHRIIASIQKRSESEYKTLFMVGPKHRDMYSIEATHQLEKSWSEGMVLKTLAKVKLNYAAYNSAFEIYNTFEKGGLMVQISQSESYMKIIEIEAFAEKSGQTHRTKIQIDMPEYIRAIKFESHMQEQGSHQYNLQAALKHGSHVLLHVDGPVNAELSHDMKKLQAEVRVSAWDSEPYGLATDILLADNKQMLSLEIKNQHETEFAIEWKISDENEQGTISGFKFVLPSVMDNTINAVVSQKHIQFNFNHVIAPRSSSPRRIKGFTDVNFENNNAQAELHWDADRDSNKKIRAEASIISATPHQSAMHGSWSIMDRTYSYKTEIQHSNPDTWLSGRKDIKLEVTSPSHQIYVLETVTDVEQTSAESKISAEIKYKNPYNRIHKINGDISMEWLGRPSNFRIKTKVDITSPEGQKSALGLEAKHEKSSVQREANIQIYVVSPSLRKELHTSFNLMNQQGSYKANWNTDEQSPAEVALWELEISPEGGVQSCKVALSMRQLLALLKATHKLVGATNTESVNERQFGSDEESDNSEYRIHYEDPKYVTHSNEDLNQYETPDPVSRRKQLERQTENDNPRDSGESGDTLHHLENPNQSTYKSQSNEKFVIDESGSAEQYLSQYTYSEEENERGKGNNFVDLALYKQNAQHTNKNHKKKAEYFILYEKPAFNSHKILIKSPLSTVEGELYHSPMEYNAKLYPWKHISDEKFELSVMHSSRSSSNNDEIRYAGSFNHPGQVKEHKLELLYSKNEEMIEGTFILDIFPNTEDKITGRLKSKKISSNSVKVEALLSGNVLKVTPRITLTATYAPHTIGFDLQVETDPSSQHSLLISGKYDRSFGRNAAFAFNIGNEHGGPVTEISGSVQAEQDPDCNGVEVASKARVIDTGSYDIKIYLCKPGYIKMLTRKHGSQKVYITRVGFQELKNAELSISERDESTEEMKHLVLSRIMLASPTMVNIDMKYEKEEMSQFWHFIAGQFIPEMGMALNNLPFLDYLHVEIPSEVEWVIHEILQAIIKILEDYQHNLIPSYEALIKLTRSDFVNSIISSNKILWSHVENIQSKVHSVLTDTFSSFISWLGGWQDLFTIVPTFIQGSARWMDTGELPEEIKQVIQDLKALNFWRRAKDMIESVFIHYPQEYEAMKNIASDVRDSVATDADNVLGNLLLMSQEDQDYVWLLRHFQFGGPMFLKLDHLVSKAIQDVFLSSFQIRGNHIEIQIPLSQPVNSLLQVPQYMSLNPIPVPENSLRLYEALTLRSADYWGWYYYNLLPKQFADILPPFNSTAVLVDGSEILTFDGTVLRAPHSPCKILLASYMSSSLSMEHPHPSRSPKLTFKTRWATVTVHPDFRVTVDGNEFTGPHESRGDLHIHKQEHEILIFVPCVIIKGYPRHKVYTVQITGWAYGNVAGLMGSYDGEQGNDWYTSHGTKAATLHELVSSWQEDQQCQSPRMAMLDEDYTSPLQNLQCHALLGVRSRCNPIVQPDSFIKMCHSSRSPCDVAKAYQAICTSKGVQDAFPVLC